MKCPYKKLDCFHVNTLEMTKDVNCEYCDDRVRVYDCFTFFNEVELLELRLATLYDYVDFFVIIEAASTFTGKDKPYNFKFPEKYADKIRYIQIGKLGNRDPWQNEYAQRNAIVRGLYDANPNDIILISDVDEIPNPVAIERGKKYPIFTMEQELFYYYVNCRQTQIWYGTMGIKYGELAKKSPQWLRNKRGDGIRIIPHGGWHYSFLGDVQRISDKLNAFAETQVNTSDINNPENITRCLATGEDLFHRKEDWAQKRFVMEIDHPGIGEWLKKYPQFYK